ncbi:MAG TPA: autotransporter-associated beta strand repeat-containing protein, partial [Pirellulales bacterium]|nr:autotransporter-associated beta strand repeat-containing protein [Pirellulales bacterium]
EFASDSSYDQATISNSGGLSLFDTTGINLYSVGGTTPYVSLGNHVYNLFQYTGSIGGQGLDGTWTTASATNPHILNAQPNTTYSFALSGGYVTLDVNSVSSAVSSNWISTNSSATHNWSDTNNWNAGVPHNAGDSASFLSTPAGVVTTVNLDASETVGALSFNSASSYAITPTASQTLTLDTGVGTTSAAVTVSLGNHAINSNVTLNSNTVVTTTNPTDSMTFNGNIGGNGKFEADGPGTVILTGTNNYVGNTTIGTTATLQLGSTGTPTSGTLGGTNLTDNGTISFNRSNSYTFSGNITGTGKVVQAGSGITTLNGTSDGYQGGTQITGGTLKMGTATALGTGSVSITSPGTLDVNATSPTLPGVSGSGTVDNTNGSTTQIILNVSTGTSTFTGAINNTGGAVSIDKQGSGTQALNGSSGYTGNTTIDAGILSVNSATSLGNGGTLTINNGTLEVNTGYSTARTVVLGSGTTPTVQVDTSQIYTNTNPSGLTGDNLTKTGAGTMALSGPLTINNTLAINGGVLAVGGSVTLTNVPTFSNSSTLELEAATNTVPLTSPLAGGTLQIDAAASYTFSGAFALASSTTVGGIYVNGGTFTATAGTVTLTGVNNTGNGNGGVITIEPGSTTNFSNISTTNADGGLLQIDGGNNTIGNVNIARSAFTASDVTIPKYTRGVIINGGITTMTGLTLGSGNSSATFSMTNGSLAVNGPISVGTGASARAEFFQVTNGTLSSTSPMQLVSVNGDAANIYLYGGTVTLPGINIFSSTVTSGTALITIGNGTTAGALYIGSSGIQATYPTGSTGNASLVLAQGGGVLGATADWSSNIPVSLTDASGTTVIQAADSVGTAHNITLSGLVSGSVTLIKTGGGKLTLTGMDSLPGITIQAGSLGTGLVNQSFGTLTLPNSATTHLDMGIGGRGETVQFNASGGELGTSSTLQVDDWTPGADHLSFPSGLNADQLALINFTGFGTGAKFVSGSSGEIEPASGMPALTFLPGDVNDDKHLDAVDILAEEKALANLSLYATAAGNPYGIPLTTDELYAVLDQNGDGQINGADVQYLITHELEGGGGSNATVPEPSSLILLGLALPAMWAARRRR